MKSYKIAVIGGDGIGPEVVREGVKVLRRASRLDGGFSFDFTGFPWGCEYYRKTGRMMPEDGLAQLRAFDAIFLGAVGAPGVPDDVSLHGLLLAIRRGLTSMSTCAPSGCCAGRKAPSKTPGARILT